MLRKIKFRYKAPLFSSLSIQVRYRRRRMDLVCEGFKGRVLERIGWEGMERGEWEGGRERVFFMYVCMYVIDD